MQWDHSVNSLLTTTTWLSGIIKKLKFCLLKPYVLVKCSQKAVSLILIDVNFSDGGHVGERGRVHLSPFLQPPRSIPPILLAAILQPDISVDYRSTIGRLSVDNRPTIGRLSTDYRSIVDRYISRQSTDKCVDR